MPTMGETLRTKAGPLPVWAWAGLGTAALTLFLVYRKNKVTAAQNNAASPNQSNLGTVPLSNLTTQGQPMPIQMGDTFVSVSQPNAPQGPAGPPGPPGPGPSPTPQTQLIRVAPTSNTPDWATLAAQPADVQSYLRALAAQVQQTGGWTTVPAGFQGIPPGSTLTASGPGWADVILPGATQSTRIPIPYPNPIQAQTAMSAASTMPNIAMPPAPPAPAIPGQVA